MTTSPSRRRGARRALATVPLLLLAVAPGVARASTAPAAAAALPPGLQALLAQAPAGAVQAVATVPGARSVDAVAPLRARGVRAQALPNLPVLLVRGTVTQLADAVRDGVVHDVHPDEVVTPLSQETRATMRVDQVRPAGLTGKGVGIAVVDSGLDATHPDLADHVTHNVKLVSGTDLSGSGLGAPLVVPVDQGPYSNSDPTSGHGTHVAGVAAADGTTSPAQTGVAPDAHLIGYGAGDALAISAALAAFDHVLEHREAWDIDVVNASWAGGALPFDPDAPVHLATKALHDAGVVVVFAAGNTRDEGSVNPHSVAPWVLSVGATDVARSRAPFSSGGVRADNADGRPHDADGRLRTDGDRLGLYHPDVMAPGLDVVSSGTPGGGTSTRSGTSFAAPHVSGLVALLLQARPGLTPAQVQQVLVGSAVPLPGDEQLWRTGFGFADAVEAVALAQQPPAAVRAAAEAAERRVLRARPHRVQGSDSWRFAPLPASAGGVDARTFPVDVGPEADALHVLLRHPSGDGSGANDFRYDLLVRDPAGAVVARGTSGAFSGAVTVLQQLAPGTPRGRFTVETVARIATTGDGFVVAPHAVLQVSRLARQEQGGTGGPSFVPDGALRASLLPGDADLTGSRRSTCSTRRTAGGALSLDGPGEVCQQAVSAFVTTETVALPGEFTSAPLPTTTSLGGTAALDLVALSPTAPTTEVVFPPVIDVALLSVAPDGTTTRLLTHRSDPTPIGTEPSVVRVEAPLTPVTVPAGHRLRLRFEVQSFTATAVQVAYGGRFGASALVLQTGSVR